MSLKSITKLNAEKYQGISTTDALVLFLSRGHRLTMSGLLYITKKKGLGEKINQHWVLYPERIESYIKETQKTIPDGWKTITELVRIFNQKNGQKIYQLIENKLVQAGKFGRKRILYANEFDIRRCFEGN